MLLSWNFEPRVLQDNMDPLITLLGQKVWGIKDFVCTIHRHGVLALWVRSWSKHWLTWTWHFYLRWYNIYNGKQYSQRMDTIKGNMNCVDISALLACKSYFWLENENLTFYLPCVRLSLTFYISPFPYLSPSFLFFSPSQSDPGILSITSLESVFAIASLFLAFTLPHSPPLPSPPP